MESRLDQKLLPWLIHPRSTSQWAIVFVTDAAELYSLHKSAQYQWKGNVQHIGGYIFEEWYTHEAPYNGISSTHDLNAAKVHKQSTSNSYWLPVYAALTSQLYPGFLLGWSRPEMTPRIFLHGCLLCVSHTHRLSSSLMFPTRDWFHDVLENRYHLAQKNHSALRISLKRFLTHPGPLQHKVCHLSEPTLSCILQTCLSLAQDRELGDHSQYSNASYLRLVRHFQSSSKLLEKESSRLQFSFSGEIS